MHIILLTDINQFFDQNFQLLENVGRIRNERKQLEQDYQQLYNKKEAIVQWEAQINEIIQW